MSADMSVADFPLMPTSFGELMGQAGPLEQHAIGHAAKASRLDDVPVTERLTYRVAGYLQAHPRKDVLTREVAAGTGMTIDQAANTLANFVKQRTDVERVARGVYCYHPGRGPGIRPKGQAAEATAVEAPPGVPSPYQPVPASTVTGAAYHPDPSVRGVAARLDNPRPKPVPAPTVTPEDLARYYGEGEITAAKVSAGKLKPATPDVRQFIELAGVQTSDGRSVVVDTGGVIYAITELT